MRCPECHAATSVMSVSASADETSIRRRRSCDGCRLEFCTLETAVLVPVRRSGVREPFSRARIVSRVRTAAQQRVLVEDAIADARQRKRSVSRVAVAQLCPFVFRSSDPRSVEAHLRLLPLEPASGRGGISANAVPC
ncbi:NrdR family transcriptional regulator [Streptomyces sp. NPDC004044]